MPDSDRPRPKRFRSPGLLGWIATAVALSTMILLPMVVERTSPHWWQLIVMIELVCAVLLLVYWGDPLRGIAVRALGAIFFLTYVIYLIAEIKAGPMTSPSPGIPSVRNAIIGLLIYGGPGLYVAIRGPAAFKRTRRQDSCTPDARSTMDSTGPRP